MSQSSPQQNDLAASTDDPGESRESFMARVRQALGRTQPPESPTELPTEPPPVADQDIVRLARPGDDLLGMFEKRATVTGMKVIPIKANDLIKSIYAKLEELGAKKLVVGVGSLPQALGLKDALRRKGLEIVDWAASPGLEVQFGVDAGITDVHAALAETGTLICNSDAGHSRGLSLVPPVHLAIVRRSDILPDMFDYWARLKGIPGSQLPSSMAFITGPSKTADIEGQLIKGVHGPKDVYIFLVQDA